MTDISSVCAIVAEIRTKYANRNIDDYETFVCARTADYLINIEHLPTDVVFTAIEEALALRKAASECNEFDQE